MWASPIVKGILRGRRYGSIDRINAVLRIIIKHRCLELVAEGRRWKNDRQEGLDLLLRMLVCPLTQEQAADWQLDTPMGAEAYRLPFA